MRAKFLLRIFLFLVLVFSLVPNQAKSQCPAFIGPAGDTTATPTYVNCMIGPTPANVTLSFINVNALNASTINWGDGVTQNFAGGITAGQILTHIYPAAIDTYLITITHTSSACVTQAHFVNERSVIAQIAPLTGSVTTICAPDIIQFVNKSTNASITTVFTLDYGDGTPIDTFDYTNVGDTISHTYLRNRVACNTIVTLTARNRCSGSIVSTNTYGPIQVYDKDSAILNSNKTTLCYPDTTATFTNSTIRNCLLDGNTQQRFERWIIPNYKGPGLDSITAWIPWPPSTPRILSFPGGSIRPRTYTVMLLDSSFCGVDTAIRTITIIDPPNAFFTSIDTVCGGTSMSFTNGSTPAMNYAWTFGDGGNSNNSNPSHTYINNGATIVSFNVQLIVTNPLGFSCRDTFIKTVYVLPRPTSNFSQNTISGNISGCDSLLVNFADLSTNATQWSWDFNNDAVIDFVGQAPPPRKFLVTSTVRLFVTSADGCLHDRTRTVTIHKTPVADFNVVSVCVNQIASFSDASTQFPGNNITTRAWNFGDPGSGASNTSTQTNPSHTFTTPGLYNVRLIIQSANACPDTIIKQLNVQFPPTANFAPTVISGCSPLAVTFNNSSVNADPNFYTWKIGNSTFSSAVNSTRTFTNNGTSNDTIRVKLIAQTTFGCRDSIIKTVVVFPNPIAGIAANTLPSCIPTPINFLNSSTGAVSFTWDFDDGNTSILPNPIHQFANNSSQLRVYNVSLVARNVNNCTDTAFIPVLVYPDQTFVINTNVDSGCSPLNVSFPSFPGVVGYQWEFGDAQSSADASPNHTYTNLTNTPINYLCRGVFTNAFGCRDTVFKTIRVFPLPTSVFSPNKLSSCSPDTISFTNSSTPGDLYRYYFGDGDSLITTSNAIVKHLYKNNSTAPVNYTARLVVVNSNGCRVTSTQNININPRVRSSFAIDSVQCSPYIALSDNRSVNGNKFYWYVNNSLVDSVQNKQFTLINTGTTDQLFELKLRCISLFGCISDTIVFVRVKPQPNAVFNTDVNNSCQPATINFTNLSTPGITYHWDFGDGETSTNAATTFPKNYTNSTLLPIQRVVQLAVENSYGCVDTFKNSITIFPFINSSFILDTVQCSPFTSLAENRSINGNKYAWYINNAFADSSLNKEFTFVNNSSTDQYYDITLRITSIFGCLDDTTIRIRVKPEPIATFITDVSAGCEPLNLSITNQSTPGISYQWDFGDGETSTNASGTFTKTFQNTSRVSIQRTIQLAVENAFGCVDTFLKTITVYPSVVSNFNLNDTVSCSPLIIQTANTSQNTLTYSWFVDNNLVDTNANPQLVIINSSNTEKVSTIRLVATSAFGCVDEFSRTVRILPVPVADFFIPNSTVKYPQNSFSFVNQNIQAGVTYKWLYGDGDSSMLPNAPSHSYSSPGSYTVTLIAYNIQCSDTLRRIATIEPPTPVVQFTGTGEGCAPLTISFQNSSLYATEYEWDFGDGIKSNEANPTHTYLVGGTYSISLIARGDGGQAVDVHVDSVVAYSAPNAFFISQPKVVFIPSDPMVLFNLSQNATQFYWDFGDGFTSEEVSPSHYYLTAGEYNITLIAKNIYGCMDTFIIEKAVKAETGGNIKVPNAFTPNPNGGNGGYVVNGEYSNDVFYPMVEGAEDYRFTVYNRWGEQLFESNDIKIGWDGYYRGVLCKQDVYVWKVELFFSDGSKKIKTGDLLLLR